VLLQRGSGYWTIFSRRVLDIAMVTAAWDKKSYTILSLPEEWSDWISQIQSEASQYPKVWDYIDPYQTGNVQIPTEPREVSIRDYIVLSAGVNEEGGLPANTVLTPLNELLYKEKKEAYTRHLEEYKEFRQGIGKAISMLAATTGTPAKPFIHGLTIETFPEVMKALKKRFAMSEKDRKHFLRRKYKQLLSMPRSGEDKWISQWESVYLQCKQLGMKEGDGTSAAEDFIDTVRGTYDDFVNYWSSKIDYEDMEVDFYEMLQKFRMGMEKEKRQPPQQGAAFPTFQGKSSPEDEKQRCVCGKLHKYAICWYLNESTRPDNFREDEKIKKRVEEALKDESLRKQVDQALREAGFDEGLSSKEALANAVQGVGFDC